METVPYTDVPNRHVHLLSFQGRPTAGAVTAPPTAGGGGRSRPGKGGGTVMKGGAGVMKSGGGLQGIFSSAGRSNRTQGSRKDRKGGWRHRVHVRRPLKPNIEPNSIPLAPGKNTKYSTLNNWDFNISWRPLLDAHICRQLFPILLSAFGQASLINPKPKDPKPKCKISELLSNVDPSVILHCLLYTCY
jgi:hypothetical protein